MSADSSTTASASSGSVARAPRRQDAPVRGGGRRGRCLGRCRRRGRCAAASASGWSLAALDRCEAAVWAPPAAALATDVPGAMPDAVPARAAPMPPLLTSCQRRVAVCSLAAVAECRRCGSGAGPARATPRAVEVAACDGRWATRVAGAGRRSRAGAVPRKPRIEPGLTVLDFQPAKKRRANFRACAACDPSEGDARLHRQ